MIDVRFFEFFWLMRKLMNEMRVSNKFLHVSAIYNSNKKP